MKRRLATLLGCGAALAALAPPLTASNHREAPITALDHKADITDVYAFMSYGPDSAGKVTLIMCVDPLLDTGERPELVPVRRRDSVRDQDRQRPRCARGHHAAVPLRDRAAAAQPVPGLCWRRDNGYAAPANSPAPVAPGTPIVPPRITSFESAGLGQRQRYTVTAFRGNEQFDLRAADGRPLYAVPDQRRAAHDGLCGAVRAGHLRPCPAGIKVFAGTTDDPFWIDLGAAFDTFNLRELGGPWRDVARRRMRRSENFVARHRLRLRGQHHRDRGSGRAADAHGPRRAGDVARGNARRVGHHLAAARVGAPQQQRRARSLRPVPPGAAHGQPAHQRADHRHGLEGSLQHGRAGATTASS